MIGGKRTDFFKNSLIKRTFIQGVNTLALAANNSHVQLWNPAASGKILIVTHIDVIINPAAVLFVSMRSHNAALGALTQGSNHYLGEADGVGATCGVNNVGQLGVLRAYFRNDTGATIYKMPIMSDCPLIIPEGLGLVLVTDLINSELSALFHWMELDI